MASATAPTPVTELFCVKCGQIRPSQASFCDHCGHPFENLATLVSTAPIQATPVKQKSAGRKFALISAVALLAIALPAAWWVYHTSTPSDRTTSNLHNAFADPERAALKAQARDYFAQAMASMQRQEHDTTDTNNLFDALTLAEAATQLDPSVSSHWHLLGYIYSRFETDEVAATLAEDALQRAIQINPGNTASRLLLAQLYLQREAYTNALDQLEWVGNKQPGLLNSALSADMCRAYLIDQQAARGEKYFQSLLTLQPQSSALRLGLAILLHDSGRVQEALQQLAQLRADPTASALDVEHATVLNVAWQGGGS
jgi:cytochrome c-type biogenesis protein CcmH/NrfG